MKQILKIVLFLGLLFVILCKTSLFFEDNYSKETYKSYMEEENNIDVLFFGSSHMQVEVSPMELYKDYGIVSYNIGNSAELMPTTYWTLKMALNIQKPRIVVIDVFNAQNDSKHDTGDLVHKGWDAFPISFTKIKAVFDVFDDNKSRLEYLFTIGKYHSRWNQMTKDDIVFTPNVQKGLASYDNDSSMVVDSIYNCPIWHGDKEDLLDCSGSKYLKRIIDECKELNIEVLLVQNPYFTYDGTLGARLDAVKYIAEEYDVEYIDFCNEDMIWDPITDMYNYDHMNTSGMHKVTDYIGQYLKEHFDLPDRRQDSQYKDWDKDYDEYLLLKKKAISTRDNLKSILMLMHDDDFDCDIYIKKGSKIYEETVIIKLLQNIARQHLYENNIQGNSSEEMLPLINLQNIYKSYKSSLVQESYMIKIRRMGKNVSIEEITGKVGVDFNDKFYKKEKGEALEVDFDEPDLQLVVYDSNTGEVVTSSGWKIIDDMNIQKVS